VGTPGELARFFDRLRGLGGAQAKRPDVAHRMRGDAIEQVRPFEGPERQRVHDGARSLVPVAKAAFAEARQQPNATCKWRIHKDKAEKCRRLTRVRAPRFHFL
jgi:hypothetical protein